MGTSGSSQGSRTGSPLVPDWAQIDGAGPVASPGTQRFKSFRTALGRFVAHNDHAQLRSALGHYARTATGGRTVGPRRFGAMAQAGGVLFGTLANLAEGGTGAEAAGVDLSSLNGTPTESAIQEIVKALTPDSGDAERVKAAMQIALSEALEGVEEFNPDAITDDVLVSTILAYLVECVFEAIMLESDRAFDKTDDLDQAAEAEAALHELVRSVVDQAMRPKFGAGVRRLTAQQVTQIQIDAVQEVWVIWERYR
jgi:hypothetical protein